jgi:DNA-binding transcriptional LysR family regulator
MRRYREGWIGRVRIGTTNTGLNYLLPPALRHLSEQHPGIDLHVTNLPTRDSVEGIIRNSLDLAIVTLPVDSPQLSVTPLRLEKMTAIFPAAALNVPEEVAPESVQGRPFILEHTRGALHERTMLWLGEHNRHLRVRMHLGTVEAIKSAVASGLGMAIIPDTALTGHETDIIVRPLRPQLAAVVALIEHRSKPDEPALAIARDVLLGLREVEPELSVAENA